MSKSISQRLAWEANRPQGDTPSTLAASWLAYSQSNWHTLMRGFVGFHSNKFWRRKCSLFPVWGQKLLFQCDHKARTGSQQICSVLLCYPSRADMTQHCWDRLAACVFACSCRHVCVFMCAAFYLLEGSLCMCAFGCAFFARHCFTGQPLMFKVSALLSGASPAPRTSQPNGPVSIALPGLQWSMLGEEKEQQSTKDIVLVCHSIQRWCFQSLKRAILSSSVIIHNTCVKGICCIWGLIGRQTIACTALKVWLLTFSNFTQYSVHINEAKVKMRIQHHFRLVCRVSWVCVL